MPGRLLVAVVAALILGAASPACAPSAPPPATPVSASPTPAPIPTVAIDLTATPGPGASPREILEHFMAARVERDLLVNDLVSENLRGSLATGQIRADSVYLYQASNPCWYRYEVLAFDQPTPRRATARVRMYEDYWSGNEGLPPQSWEQDVVLVQTPSGWRVDALGEPEKRRDEPAEPHTPTVSACLAIKMKPTPTPTAAGR